MSAGAWISAHRGALTPDGHESKSDFFTGLGLYAEGDTLASLTFLATSFYLWTWDGPGRAVGEGAGATAGHLPCRRRANRASGRVVGSLQPGVFGPSRLVETFGLNFGLKLSYFRLC